MIESLIKKLFGYCDMCDRWFQYPKRRRMSTSYLEEEKNYCNVCADCYEYIEQVWEERWSEYYHERL